MIKKTLQPQKLIVKRISAALILALLLIVSIRFFTSSNEPKKIAKPPIIVHKKLEQVTPTEKTVFFSKEDDKPVLWYAKHNNKLEFFNKEGVHPITGELLLPVTKEIVEAHKTAVASLEEPKKEPASTVFRRIQGEIIKSKNATKKPVVKKRKKRSSIWNTNLVNTSEHEEVSLFTFNMSNKIDEALSQQFKAEFLKKDYFITPAIIYSDEITNEIATNLKERKIDYFKGNLKKYTDYVCIAVASYSYSQNVLREDLLDCEMQINYYIYTADTGEIMLSESDKVIGTGQSKKKARLATIKKFVL